MAGPLSVEQRLRAKSAEQPNGCWHWTDAPSGTGYGYLSVGGRGVPKMPAHRLAYETWVGPIPEGQVVNHVCHERDLSCPGGRACQHRLCINPQHLETIPRPENTQRGRTRWTPPDVTGRPRDAAGRFLKVA